ncbi:hypothetical protein ACGFY6_16100 [Streptomyces sp. NPDC048387]|uniref:hypothetical protein n=1 Tax=Streptomyces sp. NPDC048387 TaxID=3365542 RepID=UPI003724981E
MSQSSVPAATTRAVTPCRVNIKTPGTHGTTVLAVSDRDSDLLDRARVGSERFLDTFEGAHDE